MKRIAEYKCLYLILILLFFSGNPLTRFLGNFTTIAALICILPIIPRSVSNFKAFNSLYLKIAGILLFIFTFQFFILGFISLLGALNFALKIFVGGLIIYILNEKFKWYFFLALFWLCLISLIGYITINLLGINFPSIKTSNVASNYILYCTTKSHFHQNQGMFWEPGAFAGIITLCIALNLNNFRYLWESHKVKLIIISVALFTTQSTTGYIVLFCLLGFAFLRGQSAKFKFLAVPAVIIIAYLTFQSAEFLSEKLSSQFNSAIYLDQGEFSNTRFGSLVFDWQYIKKNPVFGNGLHEKTRYADHPWILQMIQQGQSVGNGNGFSSFLASMGFVSMLGYLAGIYLALKKQGKSYAYMVLFIVILNLQGEQWLNYMIYLALPFVNLQVLPLSNKFSINPARRIY